MSPLDKPRDFGIYVPIYYYHNINYSAFPLDSSTPKYVWIADDSTSSQTIKPIESDTLNIVTARRSYPIESLRHVLLQKQRKPKYFFGDAPAQIYTDAFSNPIRVKFFIGDDMGSDLSIYVDLEGAVNEMFKLYHSGLRFQFELETLEIDTTIINMGDFEGLPETLVTGTGYDLFILLSRRINQNSFEGDQRAGATVYQIIVGNDLHSSIKILTHEIMHYLIKMSGNGLGDDSDHIPITSTRVNKNNNILYESSPRGNKIDINQLFTISFHDPEISTGHDTPPRSEVGENYFPKYLLTDPPTVEDLEAVLYITSLDRDCINNDFSFADQLGVFEMKGDLLNFLFINQSKRPTIFDRADNFYLNNYFQEYQLFNRYMNHDLAFKDFVEINFKNLYRIRTYNAVRWLKVKSEDPSRELTDIEKKVIKNFNEIEKEIFKNFPNDKRNKEND